MSRFPAFGNLDFEPSVTNLDEPLRMTGLSLGQVEAIRVEVTALSDEMKRAGAGVVVTFGS